MAMTAEKPAPKAAAPAAAVSTKPGDPAPKAKKEKVKKVPYPALNPDAEGKSTVKLKEWPADYSEKVHKRLTRNDFENEAPLLEHRADYLQGVVDKLRKEAEDCRTMGSTKTRKNAKKLRGVMEKFAELAADLQSDGVDIEGMKAALSEKLAEIEKMSKEKTAAAASA
jgi:hypothetical protein